MAILLRMYFMDTPLWKIHNFNPIISYFLEISQDKGQTNVFGLMKSNNFFQGRLKSRPSASISLSFCVY